MEKKIKNENNISKKNMLLQYLKAYKECFMKKQIIVFVVSLIIFLIAFYIGMTTIDFNIPFTKDINAITNTNILQIGFAFASVLAFLLALIPFVKNLSIITIFYSYYMAFNVVNMFFLPTCNKTFLSASVILSTLALSFNIVLSMNLSSIINERFINLKNKFKDNKKEVQKSNEALNLYLNKSFLLVTFVICMIISIVNLVVIKFI